MYVITPTFTRLSQAPDLTKTAQTLMLAKHIVHWIVIEDSKNKTHFVSQFLSRMPFPYTHLAVKTSSQELSLQVRGCSQRNLALKWIESNVFDDGVIYFVDDDNTYDVRVFKEILKTKKVGFLPVGNFKRFGISTPIIKDGKIIGYLDQASRSRLWKVDMASFGLNINFWRERGKPYFQPRGKGMIETDFLQDLNLTVSDMEPLAENCTELLAWHTQTLQEEFGPESPRVHSDKFKGTNMEKLGEHLPDVKVKEKQNVTLEEFGFWTEEILEEHLRPIWRNKTVILPTKKPRKTRRRKKKKTDDKKPPWVKS